MSCAFADSLPAIALGDESVDVVAQRHAEVCAECAKGLADLRATFAEVASSLAPETPSILARATLLDTVSGAAPYGGFARRVAKLFALAAEPTSEILRSLGDPSRWEPHRPGVELLHVVGGAAVADADAGFVRFAPGLPYPLHEHRGDEVMLLLSGSLRDDATGKVSWPGDVLLHGPGTSHSFRAGNDEPCVVALLLYGGEPTVLDA